MPAAPKAASEQGQIEFKARTYMRRRNAVNAFCRSRWVPRSL